MRRLNAVLWDVDGTLAETERDGHRVAFNRAFEAIGLPWHWDVARYGQLLGITGGRERLQHDMASRTDAPATARERLMLAEELHRLKNHHYAEQVRAGAVVLRPGVAELMGQCAERGIRMALATTTSRVNVTALLRVQLGSRWASWFEAIVCGEDVRHKKPDPEVYRQVLAKLGVSPLETLAIEDAPMGVAAARAAEVPVVVTRSTYFEHAIFDGAIAIGPGLHQRQGWRPARPGADSAFIELDDLIDWHAQMDSVSQFS